MEYLIAHLAAYRLDIVLSYEPASSAHPSRVFNHHWGTFPNSLHRAPALLMAATTAFRRSLENCFRSLGIQPQVVADFEDAALVKVVAAEGNGFITLRRFFSHH